MRIDGINENTINVDALYNINVSCSDTESMTESLTGNPGVLTMTSTEFSKNGIAGILVQDGTLESVRENAEVIKNTLDALFDKMDTGSIVKMDEEGIDINNTEADKIVTVVEQIQIKLAMYCDDFSIAGTGIDMEDIKATMGSAVSAYKAVAVMSDNARAYLVKNELEPTIENVYFAIHSGTPAGNGKITDEQWEELIPQVVNVIEEAGLRTDTEILSACRFLIESNINLTASNLSYYVRLGEIEPAEEETITERIAATRLEGRDAYKTKVNGERLPWEKTIAAIKTVMNAEPEFIMTLSYESKKNLGALEKIEKENRRTKPDTEDKEYVSLYRQMQEIRLMMTIEAGRVLENNGISVDTTEISGLVNKLRKYEASFLNNEIKTGDPEVSVEEVKEVNSILLAMEELKHVPGSVIGKILGEEVKSPEKVVFYSPDIIRKYAMAGEAYDALCTEVRKDLGDTISGAIKASTGDILDGMGYENNEANRRSIRILAYNEMEFTAKNMDAVKAADSSFNRLFRNLTPEKTLRLIREGVNILERDVDELNRYIASMDSEELKVEKYSEFLYKLDKKGEISEEEREKYIAVYRLVSRFEEEGLNSAAQLVNQGLDMTMGNLLTVYMSRHDRGMDLKADDSIRVGEVKDKVTYYKNLFYGIRNKIMPEVIEDIYEYEEQTPESFAENVMNSTKYEADGRITDNLEDLRKTDISVIKAMTEYEIPVTINNVKAAKLLFDSPDDIFAEDDYGEILDAVRNRKTLQKVYEGLAADAGKKMTELLQDGGSLIDINSMKMISAGLNIAGSLAEKNNYFIPCGDKENRVYINLKIIEDSEESGKFRISMENEKYGHIGIEGKISGDVMNVIILGNNDAGMEKVMIRAENVKEKLMDIGFNRIRISGSRSDELPDIHSSAKAGVSTEKIFKAAELFIKELAN